MRAQSHRDIIVIGGSAGSVEVLRKLVGSLPPDLPASLFIAIHFPANSVSALPQLLQRRTRLTVAHAVDHAPILPGHVYVAPPDRHLLVRPGRVRVVAGPQENGTRPAIDPLFRTAALTYGPRVIGVLLSGCLDDGTRGMAEVKGQGGVAIVQDPWDAAFAEMPRNAMRYTAVDRAAPAGQLAAIVERFVAERLSQEVPLMPKEPATLDLTEMDARQLRQRPISGELCSWSCPECDGALWRRDSSEEPAVFECRVGHAFSPATLVARQSARLELDGWSLMRGLEERASLCETLMHEALKSGDAALAAMHEGRMVLARQHAERIQQALTMGLSPESSDVAEPAPFARDERRDTGT